MTNAPIPDYRNIKAKYVLDLVERVAWTFIQAFSAQLIASGFFTVEGVTDMAIASKAAIAGIAAVLAVLKGLLAKSIGSGNTAATLPATDDTPLPSSASSYR